MKRIGNISIIYLLLMLNLVKAQFQTDVSGVGTSAANFLEIGIGARATAIGGAYASLAEDPSALYYNPAGIVWLEGMQVEFMHNNWLIGTKHDFLGVTIPLPVFRSSLGFSYIALDYGEQAVRTTERPEGTGEFWSALDYAAALTYAVALTNRFSFGLSAKYIHQQIWHSTGAAMAVDLGVQYHTGWHGLKVGMSMSNFGTQIRLSGRDLDSTKDPDDENENVDRVPVEYKTGDYPLPILFRAGISWHRSWGSLGSTLLAVDMHHPSTSTEYMNLGFEYGIRDIFFLRAGYESLFEENHKNGLTLGAGLSYPIRNSFHIKIDYAYSDWGMLDNANRFSVGLIF
jgi:opacity protein-like surface antigen